jgi:hypothetical protein
MMKNLKRLFNPFERIAGWTALLWGFGGIVLATILSYYTLNPQPRVINKKTKR